MEARKFVSNNAQLSPVWVLTIASIFRKRYVVAVVNQ